MYFQPAFGIEQIPKAYNSRVNRRNQAKKKTQNRRPKTTLSAPN